MSLLDPRNVSFYAFLQVFGPELIYITALVQDPCLPSRFRFQEKHSKINYWAIKINMSSFLRVCASGRR